MNTFTIDSINKLTVHSGDVAISGDEVKFTSEAEFAKVSQDWPTARFVKVWNELAGVKPVTKFTDRKTAIARIWKAIEKFAPAKPGVKGRAKKPANKRDPGPATSKTEQVLAALRSPNGATLKELMALTGWQSHSVRGFLSAQVAKRMGIRVRSFKRDGERTYRIRS